MNARAVLKRTRVSLRGQPLSIHGDLSPEAAIAVIKERLSGRWFPGGSTGDGFVFGYASANSITASAKRRNVRSAGRQAFKGWLIGDGAGCVLVGSMRSLAFARALVCLTFGLACFFVADTWGFVVWHAIGGGLTLSMIGAALGAACALLVVFGVYALGVAISASDAVYLREWLSDCLSADALDGRATQHGSS